MIKNKKAAAALLLSLTLIAVGSAALLLEKKNAAENRHIFAMDTLCDMTVYGENAQVTADNASALIGELDGELDAYNENGAVFKLNCGQPLSGGYAEEIIRRSIELNKLYPETDCTCGRLIDLWDINNAQHDSPPEQAEIESALETIGNDNIVFSPDGTISLKNGARLNFGSCAKGFALDKVKEKLDSLDAGYTVVSFGSSVLLYGRKPNGERFNVNVTDPFSPTQSALNVALDECFLSTSGGYERYIEIDEKKFCHIFDLSTGFPAETDIASATVISKTDGMLTDVLSTCIFIGGMEKLDEYLADDGYDVIVIDKFSNVYCSENIRDDIKILDDRFKLI